MINTVLVGHPNTGKSTLMNALAGTNEKTGNWPGVTVEKKTGVFSYQGKSICITDLPGIYSLTPPDHSAALDEKISHEFIFREKIDLIINVIDATRLEQQLYLTSQLLELGIPVVIVLNKVDLAKKLSLSFKKEKLATPLDAPVILTATHKKEGILSLKTEIFRVLESPKIPKKPITFPPAIEKSILELETELQSLKPPKQRTALNFLENPASATSESCKNLIQSINQTIQENLGAEADIIIASTRYQFAHELAGQVLEKPAIEDKRSITKLMDALILNRFLGIPLFLVMMYAIFFFSVHLGKVFQDFFQISSQALFVEGSAYWLHQINTPHWLIALVSQGIGKGICTTLSFIPVLASLFLSLSFIEMSGYMARAAFIVDKLMKSIGLSGKAFIPLIVGFGCNVPAIMATRTLSNEKERILTIMMSPFMSCSARLAIYAIFATSFFPGQEENIIFLLYLIGIVMAILTASFFKHQIKQQASQEHSFIEIPIYQIPSIVFLCKSTLQRLKDFLLKAGAIIIPTSLVIYFLNAFTLDGSIHLGEWHPNSLLAWVGKTLTPLFYPMGIQQENWPATVGLLSGILAKEIVIGTLNTLYSQTNELITNQAILYSSYDFLASFREALSSIPENFIGLKKIFHFSLANNAPSNLGIENKALGIMQTQFDGKIGAFAYLLFTLLYIPCISTFSTITKELNFKWAMISMLWSTGLAYSAAVLFYQTATLPLHILTSCAWIALTLIALVLTIFSFRQVTQTREMLS